MDRFTSVFLIFLATPFMVLVALLVCLTLGSDVLFRQQRVGLHGRSFDVFKFRTMLPGRRHASVPISFLDRRCAHKSKDDPRHTLVGRFLRRWSLDELPQLFNVILGQMSLVGPRPELPSVVARYELWQHKRHDVKPGMTGLWQVEARGEGPMELRTDLDIEYVESVSFALDIRILVATAMALLTRHGE
jgi:lipopolysaccharide/colanic/teichoic acid biosynthesis glycosyltransferase